ncbi:hypothetical protein LH483_29030, partial [Klebsiella pneumoniae]|uniref:IclR family transcriptional regulator domain-containing protein n=1 Tax=Klebsiella pneumoniae TaxID=573 RepID=UPI001E2E72C3
FNMFPIRSASLLSLRQLALLTGQTAALWVRVDGRMVRIAAVEGNQEIADRRPIGKWLPIDQCVPGWAVIAANAHPDTKLTKRLNEHLASLRTTGFVWGRSSECNEYAAAIVPPEGHVFASIAIEGG